MPSKHNILIVQDAAYATLVYGRTRLSILGRPGGKDVALELHSMSKSYNMTGWRLGFVAGAARAVQAFAEVKDNIDSGQFKAIQVAACAGIADVQLVRRHPRSLPPPPRDAGRSPAGGGLRRRRCPAARSTSTCPRRRARA